MSPSRPDFDGVVLAGGSSQRMGTDKGALQIAGQTLLRRTVAALEAGGATSTRVIGGTDALMASHPELEFVADRWPGQGPLGGVITGLDSATCDIVMVMSCDLTDASSIAVTTMVGSLGHADVALPVVEGQPQWLHTAWRTRALGRLLANFDSGARSLREGTDGLVITRVLDGDPCWYNDVDTPADLAKRLATPKSVSD